jgi:hypothetical protein
MKTNKKTVNFRTSPTKWEEINKTKTIYLCIDCEDNPTLMSANLKEVKIYCKYNFCTYVTYPVGTYTDYETAIY